MKKKWKRFQFFLIRRAKNKWIKKLRRKNILQKRIRSWDIPNWYHWVILKWCTSIETKNQGKTFLKWFPQQRLVAPSNFSFIENYENMHQYFQEARKVLHNKKSICFDLGRVENLWIDGITILIAHLKDRSFREISPAGLRISWFSPSNKTAKRIFCDSWFYKHVTSNFIPITKKSGDLVLISEVPVKTDLIRDILNNLKKICWEKFTNTIKQDMYEVLWEFMWNTKEHAWKFNKKEYYWWVVYHYDEDTNRIGLSLLDLGEGIFRTLQQSGVYKDNALWFSRNKDHLRDMLMWKVAFSSSAKSEERGHGMPTFYRFSQKPYINKAIMITNNVFANIKEDKYSRLKSNREFHWTFYFTEIQL